MNKVIIDFYKLEDRGLFPVVVTIKTEEIETEHYIDVGKDYILKGHKIRGVRVAEDLDNDCFVFTATSKFIE